MGSLQFREGKMNFTIVTERLTLRPFQAEDASVLHSIANQEHILKWMPDWKSSLEDTKRLIRYFISQYPLACKSRARVMFAVVLDDSMIGMVGIGNKKEVDNEIELAYFVSGFHTGKGYISEAATAVSRWALNDLQINYLIAIVETDNLPSQRIVEKCGFEKIETRMILNSGETREKPFYYYRLYNRGAGCRP